MRVIRNNVWETNSSSSHTVTVRGKRNLDNPSNMNTMENVIEISLGEYGWGGDPCYEFIEKLKYVMSMVLHTEYPSFNHYDEEFVIDDSILCELDGYKIILSAINKHWKCDAIIINRKRSHYYPYGYIDHQSYEDYHSLQDFLDDWNVDIERFLFDDGVVVHIDNDNH